MIKVICARSKKTKKLFYALVVNDVYVSFDVKIISKVLNCELRDVYLLEEGEEIYLNERS